MPVTDCKMGVILDLRKFPIGFRAKNVLNVDQIPTTVDFQSIYNPTVISHVNGICPLPFTRKYRTNSQLLVFERCGFAKLE